MSETAAEVAPDVFDLLPAIFRDCVDPEAKRYDLATPFPAEGFAYATDGRIAVRMPLASLAPEAAALVVVGEKGRRPKVQDLWATRPAEAFEAEPVAIPEPLPAPGPCGECGGKGEVEARDCEECDGSGEVTCDYDCEHDCPDCDGSGETEGGTCPECHGDGLSRDFMGIAVEGVGLNLAYLRPLMSAGASIFLPRNRADKNHHVRFVVGDAEGMLTPCTLPDED